jgi:hypothetical protein
MGILTALDRFVHVTRLDVLTPYGRRRHGNLRWLPLPVLLALPASYALLVLTVRGSLSSDWRDTMWLAFAAGAVFWLSFGAANLMRLFGPRITREAGALDERERMLRARAGSISYFAMTVVAVGGCFYFGLASGPGAWRPASGTEWIYLGLLLEAYAFLLPVLVASWLQPAPDAED